MRSHLKHGPWLILLSGILVATAAACSDEQPVLVSEKGFVKVGIDTSVDDVYPPGLDPSCVSPAPGYPPPADASALGSPPVPGYLPEGSTLNRQHHTPTGRHIADSYVSASGSFRFTVMHGICGGVSFPAELHWELVTVAGHWGILYEGAYFEALDGGCDWDPDFARILLFETDQGHVEVRSVVNPLDKSELLKIAESLPVFGS